MLLSAIALVGWSDGHLDFNMVVHWTTIAWTMSNPFQWTNVSLSVLLLAQSHTLNQTDICKKLCQRLNFISKELISKAEGRLVVLVYPCDSYIYIDSFAPYLKKDIY